MRLFLSRGQYSVKSGYKVAMLLYKHSSTPSEDVVGTFMELKNPSEGTTFCLENCWKLLAVLIFSRHIEIHLIVQCVDVPWKQQCMLCLVAIEPNKTILPVLKHLNIDSFDSFQWAELFMSFCLIWFCCRLCWGNRNKISHNLLVPSVCFEVIGLLSMFIGTGDIPLLWCCVGRQEYECS